MLNQVYQRWMTPSKMRFRRSKPRSGQFGFAVLEPRYLLASIVFDPATGIASAFGNNTDDVLTITVDSPTEIRVEFEGGPSAVYAPTELNEVKFWGGSGDDYFANNSSVKSFFGGHTGNDIFLGGSGNDRVMAGDGNDVIDGRGGDDYLDGGNGNDILLGREGDDELHGWFGDDVLYGGDGDDYLAGEFNDDTIYGEGGNDYALGSIGNDVIWGGDGNDSLYGQGGDDEVYGEAGNDAVRGSNGNDRLFGGDGNDFMMSDAGDDYAEGQGGDDYVFAYSGFDVLKGGDGNDQIFGESGVNELWGDAGDDLIMGGDGDDLIYGNAGRDLIYGLDGNDRMFGGQGVDHLVGGNGDDAIHGGGLSSADTMYGNAGNDRFLHQGNDVVYDRAVGDALFEFEDFSDQWTDLEIEVIDRGFKELYLATGNNILLVDTLSSDDLRFLKYDDLGGSSGINHLATSTSWYTANGQTIYTYEYTREIRIADWDESSSWYNDQYMMTAIHEIGHNWDSDLELESVDPILGDAWDSFLAQSGWTDVNPNSSNYSRSHDGRWWYLNTATFADDYGKSNPYEDLATMWEYLFTTDPADYDPGLQSKLDVYFGIFSILS